MKSNSALGIARTHSGPGDHGKPLRRSGVVAAQLESC
jgi:hypothetical protein